MKWTKKRTAEVLSQWTDMKSIPVFVTVTRPRRGGGTEDDDGCRESYLGFGQHDLSPFGSSLTNKRRWPRIRSVEEGHCADSLTR
jgi:hypothetical protein